MIGTSMGELREKIFNGHEVEFTYNGCEYSIEPDLADGNMLVQIWKCDEAAAECISTVKIEKIYDVDLIFKEKCFDGKCFNEIEAEITVDIIF